MEVHTRIAVLPKREVEANVGTPVLEEKESNAGASAGQGLIRPEGCWVSVDAPGAAEDDPAHALPDIETIFGLPRDHPIPAVLARCVTAEIDTSVGRLSVERDVPMGIPPPEAKRQNLPLPDVPVEVEEGFNRTVVVVASHPVSKGEELQVGINSLCWRVLMIPAVMPHDETEARAGRLLGSRKAEDIFRELLLLLGPFIEDVVGLDVAVVDTGVQSANEVVDEVRGHDVHWLSVDYITR